MSIFSRRRVQADDPLSLKPARPSVDGWDSTASFAPSSTNSNSNSNSNAHSVAAVPSRPTIPSYYPTSTTIVPPLPPAQATTGTSIRRRVSTLANKFSNFRPTARGRTQGIGYKRAHSPAYSSRSPSPDIRRPSGLGHRASSVDASPSPAGTPYSSRFPFPRDKPSPHLPGVSRDSPRFPRAYPVEEEKMPTPRKPAAVKMLPRSPTAAGFGFGISGSEEGDRESDVDSASLKDDNGEERGRRAEGQLRSVYVRGRTMSTPNVFLTVSDTPQGLTSTASFPSSSQSHTSPYPSSSLTSSRSQDHLHPLPSPSTPSFAVPPPKPEASLRTHATSLSVSTMTSMASYVSPDIPTLTATPVSPQFFTPQVITFVPASANGLVTPISSPQSDRSHLVPVSPNHLPLTPTTPTTPLTPTARGRRTRARQNPPIPLSLVFEHMPRVSLPVVARVSKRFRSAAQTALYASLYLVLVDNAEDPESRRTEMCIARLAASTSQTELVHTFTLTHSSSVTRPSHLGCGGTFDFTLSLALHNMKHLRELTLPSLDPLFTFSPDGPLHRVFLGLQRLKVLSHSLPEAFWKNVLPNIPNLRQLSLPHVKSIDGLAEGDVIELSELADLTAQPMVVTRLATSARALRRVEICVESTLYEGLRPGELIHALSRVILGEDEPEGEEARVESETFNSRSAVIGEDKVDSVHVDGENSVDLCGSSRSGSASISTPSASGVVDEEISERLGHDRRAERQRGKSKVLPELAAGRTLQELVLVFGKAIDARTRGKILLAVGREGVGKGLEILEVRTFAIGVENARVLDEGFYKQLTSLLPHTPLLRFLRLTESRQPSPNPLTRSKSLPPSLPPIPSSARSASFLFPLPPPSSPISFATLSPCGSPPTSPTPSPRSPLAPRASTPPPRGSSPIASPAESPSPRKSENQLPVTPAARVAHWGRLAPSLQQVLLAGETWVRAGDEWEMVE